MIQVKVVWQFHFTTTVKYLTVNDFYFSISELLHEFIGIHIFSCYLAVVFLISFKLGFSSIKIVFITSQR